MKWTTPEQLKEQVLRHWERGAILTARVTGSILFPLRLRLTKPSVSDVTERFDEVRRWALALAAGGRERHDFGYAIEWQETNHRVHGRNTLPDTAFVPSEEDALQLIGKTSEANRFTELVEITLARFPDLREWLARKPLTVLEHATDWLRILAVLEYFRTHSRPALYLRQLDIPEVDTKFIEDRKGLLIELLDRVLPETAIDTEATGTRNFERRYGLKHEPSLIRFRILDPALLIQGLSDLSVPPEQFARLVFPVRRIFITENKVNGLAFPDIPGGLVIFGLGYGLERLAEIGWLHERKLWYWGDIDTHGFAILDRLRAKFPLVRSFLMDRDTLMAHATLWGQEEPGERFDDELVHLTPSEKALFEDLKHNRLGEWVRLEQERIGYGWVRHAIQSGVIADSSQERNLYRVD
jgi:hypothetical protein